MLKVDLCGTLHLTNDLASRLQSRGLLSASGLCTEELILFIQECIARDDNRCSILADKSSSNISLPSAVITNTVDKDAEESENNSFVFNDSPQDDEDDPTDPSEESTSDTLQSSLNSLVDESDLAALRQGLSTLYQGG